MASTRELLRTMGIRPRGQDAAIVGDFSRAAQRTWNVLQNAGAPPSRGIGALYICAALMLLGGCAGAEMYSSSPSFSSGETQLMTGDWNDVEAAARVGTEQCQMAIVRVETPSPDRYVFSITTPTDEHGKLIARRRLAADPSLVGAEGPVAIEWNASIGLFGDTTQEKKLLQAVQTRMMDLKGVDWAPLRKR